MLQEVIAMKRDAQVWRWRTAALGTSEIARDISKRFGD